MFLDFSFFSFFYFFCFISFSFTFYPFSLIFIFVFCPFFFPLRPSRRQNPQKKSLRKSYCKNDDFLVWNFDVWASVDRKKTEGVRKAPFESDFAFCFCIFFHFSIFVH